jgi:hypothetical protein
MAYGPQIPGLDKSGGGVNLAAPGAIGGTTAGSGAFTTLTASNTLAVTQATTLSGALTLGVPGDYLLTTTSSIFQHTGSATATLGINNSPGYGEPIKWIAINDNNSIYFLPLWSPPP